MIYDDATVGLGNIVARVPQLETSSGAGISNFKVTGIKEDHPKVAEVSRGADEVRQFHSLKYTEKTIDEFYY